MPSERLKSRAASRYGQPPAQGTLALGTHGEPTNRLEQRLLREPELLRRIAEAASDLARGKA